MAASVVHTTRPPSTSGSGVLHAAVVNAAASNPYGPLCRPETSPPRLENGSPKSPRLKNGSDGSKDGSPRLKFSNASCSSSCSCSRSKEGPSSRCRPPSGVASRASPSASHVQARAARTSARLEPAIAKGHVRAVCAATWNAESRRAEVCQRKRFFSAAGWGGRWKRILRIQYTEVH